MYRVQQFLRHFRRHLRLLRQAARLLEFGEQIGLIAFALFRGRLKSRIVGQRTQPVHDFQIASRPISGQRRDIVGADHRNGLHRIMLRQLETVLVFAEIHDLVRGNLVMVEQMARLVGHRTQILADDHAAVAVAFQSQYGEHNRSVIMHIRAEIRRFVADHPPQAAQRHHMIDTQHAVQMHVFTQNFSKLAITRTLERLRIQRRQAPVLSRRPHRVGRRADGHIHTVAAAVKPSIRAAPSRADGQIPVDAEFHPVAFRRLVDFGKLFGTEPLQPHIKVDFPPVRLGEILHGLAIRVAELLRPDRPADRVRFAVILVERLKQAESVQIAAFTGHKVLKRRPVQLRLRAAVLFESIERDLQRISFQFPH